MMAAKERRRKSEQVLCDLCVLSRNFTGARGATRPTVYTNSNARFNSASVL